MNRINKKGVNLTLSTIVVAALVLAVMIILVAVLTGQTKNFLANIKGKCPVEPGNEKVQCVSRDRCKDGFNMMKACENPEDVCCNFGKEEEQE